MRLDGQECMLDAESLARRIYGSERIVERHRHRYEVNEHYLPRIIAAGMEVSGRSTKDGLCEMTELRSHPWFVACQFHPVFTWTPRQGHALFNAFVQAALDRVQTTEQREPGLLKSIA